MQDQPLPERNRDHALTCDYVGTRECHVAPDWLLIYLKTGDTQTGSHPFESTDYVGPRKIS